jgi:hypothetical protein
MCQTLFLFLSQNLTSAGGRLGETKTYSEEEKGQHHIQLCRKEGVLGNQGSQLLIATQKVTIIIPPCPPPADVCYFTFYK